MNPLPKCCFPHSAPIPHQFVMKVYVDAWIYVTEKFVNMGNIELYEGILRYKKADYPPIPSFIALYISLFFRGPSFSTRFIQKRYVLSELLLRNALPADG